MVQFILFLVLVSKNIGVKNINVKNNPSVLWYNLFYFSRNCILKYI